MKLSIVFATLLSNFATPSPDLCADVLLNASGKPITDLVGQTLSRYCQWSGPEVPAWNADVCCTFAGNQASCTRTDTRGRCSSGAAKRYCEHGSLATDGHVTCFQPFPDGCEAGMCIETPEIIPEAQMSEMIMCCNAGGACQFVEWGQDDDCQGELLSCNWGWVDNDGNIECWE